MIGGGVATVATLNANWTLLLTRMDNIDRRGDVLERKVTDLGGLVVEQGKFSEWRVDMDRRVGAIEAVLRDSAQHH